MAILDHNSSALALNRCIITGPHSTEATATAARTSRARIIKDRQRTTPAPKPERPILRRNQNEHMVLHSDVA